MDMIYLAFMSIEHDMNMLIIPINRATFKSHDLLSLGRFESSSVPF